MIQFSILLLTALLCCHLNQSESFSIVSPFLKDACSQMKTKKTTSLFVSKRNPRDNFQNADPPSFSKKMQKMMAASLNPLLLDSERRKGMVLKERAYSRKSSFQAESMNGTKTSKDTTPVSREVESALLKSLPSFILSFAIPFVSFPYLVELMRYFITVDRETLHTIIDKFGPGVSVLYGTFISLTVSRLYIRKGSLQDIATRESSQIAVLLNQVLALCKIHPEIAGAAGQCVADQVKTLSAGKRSKELFSIMRNDPYARVMELIEQIEDDSSTYYKLQASVRRRSDLRNTVQILYQIRARRISIEDLFLPTTHFFILTLLTNLILFVYVIDISSIQSQSVSLESSFLFGLLCNEYVLFYNFSRELNEPFSGIYQIQRGAVASHLIQAKRVLSFHPLFEGKVKFKRGQRKFTPEEREKMRGPMGSEFTPEQMEKMKRLNMSDRSTERDA